MTEESIWRMENIRIKYGRSGFLELDLFRARYRLLDVADADHNAELREFLGYVIIFLSFYFLISK